MAGSIIAWQISKYTGAHLVKVTGLLRRKVNTLKDWRRGHSFIARGDGMYATDGKGKVLWCQGLLWASDWVPHVQPKLSFMVPIARCHCIVLGNWVVSAWWLRMQLPSLRCWSCCCLPVQLWASHLNSWDNIIFFQNGNEVFFSLAFSKI